MGVSTQRAEIETASTAESRKRGGERDIKLVLPSLLPHDQKTGDRRIKSPSDGIGEGR